MTKGLKTVITAPVAGILSCLAAGWIFCSAAEAQSFHDSQQVESFKTPTDIGVMPDVHFWTNANGVPQLDWRADGGFVGASPRDVGAGNPSYYSGAVNNGEWRGFRAIGFSQGLDIINNGTWLDLGPDVAPQVMAFEKRSIAENNSHAPAAIDNLNKVQLSDSGIFWGVEKIRKKSWFGFADRIVTREAVNGRSYLRGPVKIRANYIRFDGPIGRIGSDVILEARHLVVDGVELPPQNWRGALAEMQQKALLGAAPKP